MIYLIDDKKLRQVEFGWNEEKLQKYSTYLTPLYSIDEIAKIGESLYEDGNIILYHESFLDFTQFKDKASNQRSKIFEESQRNPALSIVFFSGSQSTRSLDANFAYIPVGILYRNLEIFIQRYKQNDTNLKYLLFGAKPDIEEYLAKKLIESTRIEGNANPANILGRNLFIRPYIDYLQSPIMGAKEVDLYLDVSDLKLTEKIKDWLNNEEYDNIFIPLCFGKILSDYNGLRLAAHIRCTETKNQTKRIIIYGFVGIEHLIDNEYFDILKTKGVELVGYSKKQFQELASRPFSPLKIEELPFEIRKLQLQTPKNYLDNHSVANEWAIYQWAKILGCDETEEITKIIHNVESNLYFKYLKTIHPISEFETISQEELKINFEREPRVLLIDDEADKGWYEVLAHLMGDINNIWIDYLGDDFKKLNSDEIIHQSIEKIKTDNIDIVILDFRLNPSDFEKKDIEEITSVKLLKRIKEYNPGIQVIAFSATNKVWNLLALQSSGVDLYVNKELRGNLNAEIIGFTKAFERLVHKALWLKQIYSKFKEIENSCLEIDFSFQNSVINNFKVTFSLLEKSFSNSEYLKYSFLQLFLCIEEFLRQPQIFEFGDKCYVNQNILVARKVDNINWESVIKYKERDSGNNIPSHFVYENNEETVRLSVGVDYKMACVLIFLFNQENSNVFDWPEIRDLRNSFAHIGGRSVKKKDIDKIIAFLEKVLNKNNFSDSSRLGLNDEINVEKLNSLKDRFNAR